MASEFERLILEGGLEQAAAKAALDEIYRTVLRASPYMKSGNFTQFHGEDLKRLFEAYDRAFFAGHCRRALGTTPLRFRISPRMTSAGGKTTWFRSRQGNVRYEISVSSTLLFRTFDDTDHRPITVSGILCHDRLQALQRVMEHEIMHLVEMLLWNDSNCRGPRFQSAASRFFHHLEHTHRLITPREQAYVQYGIRPGSRVKFRFDGVQYEGVVNRITKRATVLVPHPKGAPYSDGHRYEAFYVPVTMLTPVEQPRGE